MNIEGMPVNKHRCHSCPFNEGGCQSVRQRVASQVVSEASQLCHGTDNKTLCRGARDLQLEIFHRLGVVEAPTDEAWAKAWAEMKGAKSRVRGRPHHAIGG
jgi:hypothetical protein